MKTYIRAFGASIFLAATICSPFMVAAQDTDLQAEVSFLPTIARPGDQINVTIEVANKGSDPATDVVAEFGFSGVDFDIQAIGPPGACAPAGDAFQCDLGDLGSVDIVVIGEVLTIGALTVSGHAQGDNAGQVPIDGALLVEGADAAYQGQINADPNPVAVDDLVTVIVDIQNTGSEAGPGLVLDLQASSPGAPNPEQAFEVTAVEPAIDCDPVAGPGRVVCQLGDLPAGENAQVAVTGIPSEVGDLLFAGGIQDAHFNEGGIFGSVHVRARAVDYTGGFEFSDPEPGVVNDALTVVAIISNEGPDVGRGVIATLQASNPSASNPLEPMEILSVVSDADCADDGFTTVICELGDLAGEDVLVTITAIPLDAGTFQWVTQIEDDHGNTGSVFGSFQVVARDVVLDPSIHISPSPPEAGPLEVVFAIFNDGLHAARDVHLTAGFEGIPVEVDHIDPPDTCQIDGGLITCVLGDISPSQPGMATIVLSTEAQGVLDVFATAFDADDHIVDIERRVGWPDVIFHSRFEAQ